VRDAGYDVTRLAFLLADLPVELLGRLRSILTTYKIDAHPDAEGSIGRRRCPGFLADVIRCSWLAGHIVAAVIGGTLGGYPGRTGGPWLCRTFVLSLFQAVVVPSGFRTSVQPHRWITTW
jgi:hypothetical protein